MATIAGKDKYKLVYFVDDKGQGKKSIDIVPATWIQYNLDKMQLFTKFMPPPYTTSTAKKLSTLVETCAPPENSFKLYPVEIRGKAQTYEEATTKLEELEIAEYVFSSSDGVPSEKKSELEKKKYQLKASADSSSIFNQLNSAACSLETIVESDSATKKTDQKNTKQSKPQLKEDVLDSDLSASDSDEANNSKESADSEMSSATSPHAQSSHMHKSNGAKKTNTPHNEPGTSTSNRFGVEQAENSTKKSPTSRPRSVNEMQGVHDASKFNNPDENDVLEYPTHPGSSIQKQIAEYFSLHRADVNDPLLLAVGGMWSLNMQLAQIRSMLCSMKVEVTTVKSKVDTMIVPTAGNANNIPIDDDEALGLKNKTSLPWDTMEKFNDFEVELTQCKKLQKQVKDYCKQLVTKDLGATKSMGIILRAFMTQALAKQFTTKKQMPNKSVFSNTALYKCFEEFALQYWKDGAVSTLSSIQFQSSIKAVLNNVKDWHGSRTIRLKAAIDKKKAINEKKSEENKHPNDSEENGNN